MAIDEKKYLDERVDNQIDWHDRKSSSNQKWFKRLQLISLICAALIPFISGWGMDGAAMRILVGGLGVVIAIMSGAVGLYQFQKLWIGIFLTASSVKVCELGCSLDGFGEGRQFEMLAEAVAEVSVAADT